MAEPPGTGTVEVMTAHLPRNGPANRPANRPATGPDAASPAPRLRTTFLTSGWSRAVVLAGAVAAGGFAVSGCDFATDTPLSVTSTTRAVAPGDPITGKVIYPDGKITVTIAPFASARNAKLHRTAGEKSCEYHRFSKKYSCPTTDLEQGLYIVQVTDAAQPGEGTAEAQVAVTDAVTEAGGYDPHIVISNHYPVHVPAEGPEAPCGLSCGAAKAVTRGLSWYWSGGDRRARAFAVGRLGFAVIESKYRQRNRVRVITHTLPLAGRLRDRERNVQP